MGISGKSNFEPSEDISHERLEEKLKKYTQKKQTSTPFILPPIGATTNEMVANQVRYWEKIKKSQVNLCDFYRKKLSKNICTCFDKFTIHYYAFHLISILLLTLVVCLKKLEFSLAYFFFKGE